MGNSPFFMTGANAKIKVNGVTLAFCTGLSYDVIINTANPRILGGYEAVSLDVLSYEIKGQFSIVKYNKGMVSNNAGSTPDSVVDSGNGIGNWGTGSWANDGKAYPALDPSTFSTGTFFDIEVYQKAMDTTNTIVMMPFAKIRECRIVAARTVIQKKTATIQTFAFIGKYLDEDSFLAIPSVLPQNM